jgi:hypothetical protein
MGQVNETQEPSERAELSCSYSNGSDQMVILRCLGPGEFFLERVVFPFEQLSFHCPGGSDVEIWTYSLGGPELVERFEAEAVSCCCT